MRTIAITVCLLIISSFMFAQEISSFRNLSTGRALLDNLDLILDPLDIRYVSGIRLYTNLSNFSSEDRIFMNDGSNHFLMAISSDQMFIEGFRAALMMTYHDNKHPRPIQYQPNPWIGDFVTAYGEVEHIWQEFRDTDSNGLYDWHHRLQQSYKNNEYQSGNELYLNLSYQINDEHALGMKIGQFVRKGGFDYLRENLLGFNPGTPSFFYHEQVFNLPENDPAQPNLEQEYQSEGLFETEMKESRWLTHLAYAFQPDNIEYRAGLILAVIKDNEMTEDEIYLSATNENALFEFEREVSGLYYALQGGARYTFQQMPERRYDGFVSMMAQIGSHNLDNTIFREHSYSTTIFNEFLFERIAVENSDQMMEKGKIKSTDFMTTIRFNYPLNDRTYFGSGFTYQYTGFEMDNDFQQAYTATDSVFAFMDDTWLQTNHVRSSIKGKSKHQDTLNLISIPVGLEYWFTNNRQWALRFGSQFIQRIDTINTLYQPTHVEPWIDHIYLPDEEEPIIIIEDNHYEIASENRKVRTSQTFYSYGVCYSPSRNLQIDLMGLFEQDEIEIWTTDFVRNLRLSFSLRF